jgi:hypothetical protein
MHYSYFFIAYSLLLEEKICTRKVEILLHFDSMVLFDLAQYQFTRKKEKNDRLQKERNISFEQVVKNLHNHQWFIIPHYNTIRYGHQYLLIIQLDHYPHVVPFVITDWYRAYLITIYPSNEYKNYF